LGDSHIILPLGLLEVNLAFAFSRPFHTFASFEGTYYLLLILLISCLGRGGKGAGGGGGVWIPKV